MAAVAGARAWALAEWWWASGEAAQWIWDPFAPAGYSSAGAFVGAGLMLWVARRVFGEDPFRLQLEAVAPAAFVALACARLGCVFERCDPGRPSEVFGVAYPDGPALHAFGAYVALPTLAVVAGAVLFCKPDGRRAPLIVAGYALVRFVAEFFREAPTLLHLGHAVALIVGFSALAWWKLDGARVEKA